MATTKIWPIRDSLKRVLDYAENPDKTGYLGLRQVLEYRRTRTRPARMMSSRPAITSPESTVW